MTYKSIHRFGYKPTLQHGKGKLDTLGGTQARGGGIQQWDIAIATSMSEKTTEARQLQVTTQGTLDIRIMCSVNTLVQNLVPD